MKIGFFGCGNMGKAIAEGIRKSDSKADLYFYTPSSVKAEALAKNLKGKHVLKCAEMPADLDWYILAFKPQSLSEFSYSFAGNSKILSVLAGVGIETIAARFKSTTIARLMPNTPSSLGEGACLLYSPGNEAALTALLSSLGKIYSVESEEQLDALTPFTGSGPALVFEFARQFEVMLAQFTDHIQAREMIAQTFLGSAHLMMEAVKSGITFEELRDQVTSKKGVTHEALEVMKEMNLTETMNKAFKAAHRRTLEIKKGSQ